MLSKDANMPFQKEVILFVREYFAPIMDPK
jgi:hypothetical protein